jgi:hypothetical protein
VKTILHPLWALRYIWILLALSLLSALLLTDGEANLDASAVYFEFGVDLIYSGKPVSVRRVVKCIPPFVDRRTFPAKGRSQEAIAERLSDGSGVIIVVPSMCEPEAWPLIDNYVPLIIWTNNANDPQELELYLSEQLLRSGHARVTLNRAYASKADAKDFVGTKNDFILFSGEDRGDVFRKYTGPSTFFNGLVARFDGFDEWSKIPGLATELSSIHSPRRLLYPVSKDVALNFPAVIDFLKMKGGNTTRKMYDNQSVRSAFDNATPLRWRNDAFFPDTGHPGIAVLYPSSQTPLPPSKKMVWPLQISGERLEVGGNAIYYFPASKLLASTNWMGFHLVKREN